MFLRKLVCIKLTIRAGAEGEGDFLFYHRMNGDRHKGENYLLIVVLVLLICQSTILNFEAAFQVIILNL